MIRAALLPLIVILSGLAPQRLYKERTGHAARNILTERPRLDPQRAAKAFSFIVLALSIFVVMRSWTWLD